LNALLIGAGLVTAGVAHAADASVAKLGDAANLQL
jgi:hypothetical protein